MASEVQINPHQRADVRLTAPSISEVEDLIATLYRPGLPSTIKRAEVELKRIQKLPEAWQLADALLASQNQNCRFFGALTFTVKVHNDLASLPDSDIDDLLARFLTWLVRLVAQQERPLVVRKLCSTLVAYFLHPKVTWTLAVRQVVCSLYRGEPVQEGALDRYPSTSRVVSTFDANKSLAAIWFSSTLAEEGGKGDSGPRFTGVLRSLGDANELMEVLMPSSVNYGEFDPSVTTEAIKSLQAWIAFSHKTWVDHSTLVPTLKSLIRPTIRCLGLPGLFDPAAECLSDLFYTFPAFPTADDYASFAQLIQGPWAMKILEHIRESNFEEDEIKFAKLLVAYGYAEVENLAKNPQSSATIVEIFHVLMQCEGTAAIEDEVCVLALEFWTRWAEYTQDAVFEVDSDSATWIPPATMHIGRAIEELRQKVVLPAPEVWESSSSEDQDAFRSFRMDVQDLLQASYALIGLDLLQHCVRKTVDALNQKRWNELEASLFYVSSISESLATGASEDAALKALFGSSLFSELSDHSDTSFHRSRATHEAARLIGEFKWFFEHVPEGLPNALNFLFSVLDRSAIANQAADSIAFLCRSCRRLLLADCGTFISQYENINASGSISSLTKNKLLGAIAALIQAIPSDEDKLVFIARLFRTIEARIRFAIRMREQFPESQDEVAHDLAVEALRTMVALATGYQSADEEPIDLEDEQPLPTFWIQGLGSSLQNTMVQCLAGVTKAFGSSGEITEAICDFLRAGIKEPVPGPFVLAPNITVEYVTSHDASSPRLEYVLMTACMLINAHSSQSRPRIDLEARTIYAYVTNLVSQLQDPSKDPEIAQSCVEVLSSLVNRYSFVLFDSSIQGAFEIDLEFIYSCLNGNDVLPKRSAADFWSKFIRLDDTSAAHETVIDLAGPVISLLLIIQIGGNAPRSELDFLSEPLKALVFKFAGRAKRWLEAALQSPKFTGGKKITEVEKRGWLGKMMTLRGGKNTNKLVREFWLMCRGQEYAYTSTASSNW